MTVQTYTLLAELHGQKMSAMSVQLEPTTLAVATETKLLQCSVFPSLTHSLPSVQTQPNQPNEAGDPIAIAIHLQTVARLWLGVELHRGGVSGAVTLSSTNAKIGDSGDIAVRVGVSSCK